jgi:hypothetical protein
MPFLLQFMHTSASLHSSPSALGTMRALGSLHRLLLPSALQLLPRGLAGQATKQLPIAGGLAGPPHLGGSVVWAAERRIGATFEFALGARSCQTTFAPPRPLMQVRLAGGTSGYVDCSHFSDV